MLERGQQRHDERRLITIFSVGDLRFAIRVENMAEIVQLSDITPGPEKRYVIGSVDLRGEKIPVLDLEKFMGIGTRPEGPGIRSMIVLKRDGPNATLPTAAGIIVDRIEGVHQETELAFSPFPHIARNDNTGVYQGVFAWGEELILFLHAGALIERVWAAR